MLLTKDEGFAYLAEDPGDKSFLRGVKIISSGDDGHGFTDLREGVLVLRGVEVRGQEDLCKFRT